MKIRGGSNLIWHRENSCSRLWLVLLVSIFLNLIFDLDYYIVEFNKVT